MAAQDSEIININRFVSVDIGAAVITGITAGETIAGRHQRKVSDRQASDSVGLPTEIVKSLLTN